MSRGSAAKAARERKERHPELYCSNAVCLWRTGGATGKPCPRHRLTIAQELTEMEARDPALKALGDRINAVGDAIAARQAVTSATKGPTMTSKAFPIENVLTVYTGVCMKTGVGIAQNVFDHLYPGIMTIGCAMKQPEAAQALAIQHPQLAAIRPIDQTEGDYLRFLNDARVFFGDTIAVNGPLPGGPNETPVIVVETPPARGEGG